MAARVKMHMNNTSDPAPALRPRRDEFADTIVLDRAASPTATRY